MAEKINVYTPIQGTIGEKYFNHIVYKGKMSTMAGNEHLSVHFFLLRLRLFHLSTQTSTGLSRQKRTSKCFFPHRHKKLTYTKDHKDFP